MHKRISALTPLAAFASLGLALGLSACGSGTGTSDSSSNQHFTGDPVTVMTIAPINTAAINEPEIFTAAQAAVKSLNDGGGLNGHEVKLITCNDGNDPNTAAACARQAVSENAIAVVGGFTTSGANILPVLESAHIPWIGPPGFSANELASQDSYPLIAGATAFAGLGARAVKDGCKSTASVLYDVPPSVGANKLIGAGVAESGGKSPADIMVPTTTTDFSSVAKKAGESDCVIIGLPNDQVVAMASAGAGVGVKSRYYLVAGALNKTVLSGGAGGALDGAVSAVSFVAASNPVWKAAEAASSDVDWTGAYNQDTWASYQVLKDVLVGQPNVTAATVISGLAGAHDIDAGGLMAPVDFTKEFAVPGLNRVFNRKVVFLQAKNGEVVQDGGFEDLSALFGG